jgi:copper homeostasis protein
MPELEVIATTVEDAITAEKGGATSVEIITNLAVGGLTPAMDLVRGILDNVQVATHVIVRPHAETFIYNDSDKQVMLQTVRELAKLPLTSVVIGGMTANGDFDFDLLRAMLDEIEAERITIHRVIDHVNDPFADLQTLSQMIGRVLCSGAPTDVYAGRNTMGAWVKALGANIHFKCGGGITFDNITAIQQAVNAPMYHVGGCVRKDGAVDLGLVEKLVELLQVNQKGDP